MLVRIAPFAFVLLWSSSFIASRVGLRYLSPLLFVTVRMVLAAAVLLAVTLTLRRSWRVLSGRWGHLAVAGVLTNSVLLLPAHYAMVHVGAAQIALVQTLNPLLTALLAWPLLGERLRPLQWLGLVLGAAGVVLIVGLAAAAQSAGTARSAADRRRCGGAVRRHAVFRTVLPRRADPGGDDGATAGSRRGLRGGDRAVRDAACDVDGGRYRRRPYGTRRRYRWAGWGSTIVMLARGTVARATANFYLVPGTAALMAWVLLDEGLSALTVVGLAVSSLGCWLVSRRERTVGAAVR